MHTSVMANRWDYHPAGFEDDSDEDDFTVSGNLTEKASHLYDAIQTHTDAVTEIDAEMRSKKLNNSTQAYDEFDYVGKFKSGLQRMNLESRADPVIKRGKSLPIILLDDLRRAAIRNDVSALDALLQAGIDIESRLNSGWTVLMHAVHMANTAAVRLLLERGANSNESKDGLTVLMTACGSDTTRHDDLLCCVDMLLDRGVEINAYNRNHCSSLMYAALGGHTAVVQRLIEKGAEINEQGESGYTALMHAAERGHTSVVEVLLDAKADVRKVTPDGYNAADLAFMKHHQKLQQLLDAHLKGQVDGPGGVGVSEELESVKDEVDQEDHWSYPKSAEEVYSYTFSNLDLFLSGLKLSELIPVFTKENITFDKFLRLKDDDLVEMGIHQLGIRKKILDALKETHKRNWETSSLIPIDYNKKLMCPDAVGMIANVEYHATYIASTIGYLSDHVSADNDIVLKAPENEIEDLCINVEETIANIRLVHKELRLLKSRLGKICRNHDFSSPDLVKPVNSSSRFTQKHVLLAAAATLSCILYVAWFHRQTIPSVVSRGIFRIFHPRTVSSIGS